MPPSKDALTAADIQHIEDFLKQHNIDEVEFLLPDMAGIARGKILPADRFVRSMRSGGLRMPEQIFIQTVTGDYPDPADDPVTDPAMTDVALIPDASSIRLVPWYEEPTAQVICDAVYFSGKPVTIASRYVLKRVIELYEEKGWRPVVAPEAEFYLVEPNEDSDYPCARPSAARADARSRGSPSASTRSTSSIRFSRRSTDFCEAQDIASTP